MVVVAENEAGDDGRDLSGGPKSPWKTPVAAPDAKAAADADTWPALADAQRPKSNPDASKSPPLAAIAAPPPNAAAPPPVAVQVWLSFLTAGDNNINYDSNKIILVFI